MTGTSAVGRILQITVSNLELSKNVSQLTILPKRAILLCRSATNLFIQVKCSPPGHLFPASVSQDAAQFKEEVYSPRGLLDLFRQPRRGKAGFFVVVGLGRSFWGVCRRCRGQTSQLLLASNPLVDSELLECDPTSVHFESLDGGKRVMMRDRSATAVVISRSRPSQNVQHLASTIMSTEWTPGSWKSKPAAQVCIGPVQLTTILTIRSKFCMKTGTTSRSKDLSRVIAHFVNPPCLQGVV